jgi:hypothetical protein
MDLWYVQQDVRMPHPRRDHSGSRIVFFLAKGGKLDIYQIHN